MIYVDTVPNGLISENCYIISDGSHTAIIDPGSDAASIKHALGHRKPDFFFITHRHWDHIGALAELATDFPEAPIYAHELDANALADPKANGSAKYNRPVVAPLPDVRVIEGDTISLGKHTATVLHTPGHSIGSCCLFFEGTEFQEPLLFSGDTLFARAFGRTDLETGNAQQMAESLTRLAQLPPQTRVFPGHHHETTIQKEINAGTISPYGTRI